MSILRKFLGCQSGATAIEYALIAGFVFLAIVASIIPIGQNLSTIFANAASNMR